MEKQKLTENAVLPPLPAPAGEITVCWGTPQQTFADGFSAAQMDARARAAWTMGLDYGMTHAPAADETMLPDLARLLGTASKEGKAVKLSPIAAGTLYNAMTSAKAQAKVERDAARYRWLRNQMSFSTLGDAPSEMTLKAMIPAPEHNCHTDWMEERFDASVDAAVDAAMAKGDES